MGVVEGLLDARQAHLNVAQPPPQEPEPVDPIDELMRIVGGQEPDPPQRRGGRLRPPIVAGGGLAALIIASARSATPARPAEDRAGD